MKPGDIVHSRSIAVATLSGTDHLSASRDRRRKGEPTRVFQFLFLGVTALEDPQDGMAIVEKAVTQRCEEGKR